MKRTLLFRQIGCLVVLRDVPWVHRELTARPRACDCFLRLQAVFRALKSVAGQLVKDIVERLPNGKHHVCYWITGHALLCGEDEMAP